MADTKSTTAGPKQAPPAPKPVSVTFESPAKQKRVYNDKGDRVARFEDGRFTTDDEALQKLLDGLDDVRRAD